MPKLGAAPALEVRLLGQVEVLAEGTTIPIRGKKQLLLTAILASRAGSPLHIDELIDALWGARTRSNEHALHQQISTLRAAIDPRREGRVLSSSAGYVLHADRTDIEVFEDHARSAFTAVELRETQRGRAAFRNALACWRGPALADLRGGKWADTTAARFEERRLAVTEAYAALLLDDGALVEAIDVTERVLATDPFRERVWELLMLALYRAGRPADALTAYQRCRGILVESLGMEPTAALSDLERRILNHDPDLLSSSSPNTHLERTHRNGHQSPAGELHLFDGQVIVIDRPVLIGRAPDAIVRVIDSRASRRHALVEPGDAGGALLRDLGSTNGTKVNGEVVVRRHLTTGDVVSIGGAEFVYR